MSAMPTDTRTPKHRLLDVLMRQANGDDLRTYIERQRAAGQTRRQILRDIEALTGEQLVENTLVNWGLLP